MFKFGFILLCLVDVYITVAFKRQISKANWGNKLRQSYISTPIHDRPQVNIYDSPDTVGKEMCDYFVNAAKSEISKKGAFYVAVPGGSAVKLLKFLKDKKDDLDWSKVNLFYVNHKCVPNDDDSATHLKARNIFLDSLNGKVNVHVVPDSPSLSANERAAAYEKTLKTVVPEKNGLPYFDLVVLGFGKDGHIGSLYPGRNEVNNHSALVLPVDKKSPASVTITLPVFNNAKDIIVITVGADKAEAASCAIRKTKSMNDFPVCGVRVEGTTFMIDKAASANL